jgi:Trk K+ transport system NAD-binding subunit
VALRQKKSGGQRTASTRQRARTERLANAGLKKVPVIVPATRENEIKAIAAEMVADSQACENGQDNDAAR